MFSWGEKHDLENGVLERGIRCDVLGPRLRVVYSKYHTHERTRTRTHTTHTHESTGHRIFTPRDEHQQDADRVGAVGGVLYSNYYTALTGHVFSIKKN